MFRDLRLGCRMLARSKTFTFIAILTLALGIGGTTAIFSVVNALLLRPLPYQQPERLVWIDEAIPIITRRVVPAGHFLDWQERSQLLDGVAAFNTLEMSLVGAGEPEQVEAGLVSARFFPTLGARMLLGRNFLPEEDRAGGERVVILSHSLWRRRFNEDRSVVGRSIRLNDNDYRVVGVAPPDFRFFSEGELWAPLALDYAQEHATGMIRMLSVFGRLKPGATPEQARAELETIRQSYEGAGEKKSPLFQGRLRLSPLHRELAGETRRLLVILLGAVSLILLIACANVANLTLARAAVREKELAIRAALGAGRLRLIRQLLTESLLLAGAGGLAGLLLAWRLTKFLAQFSPEGAFGKVARLTTVNVDWRALGYTLLASLLAGVIFGLAPALQFSRPELNHALKESPQHGRFSRRSARQALLIAEVALAVVLLIGAGLLIRSFANLLNVEPGFRAANLLTCRLTLPSPRYDDDARRAQFQVQVLQRLVESPGVESVGAINHLPMTDFDFGVWLQVEGRPGDRSQRKPSTPLGLVNQDYFRTLEIPLRMGRIFDERDTAESPRVVILSEALARRLFPDENPIGKRVNMDREQTPVWNEVIGVVGAVRQELAQESQPMIYAPYRQRAPQRIMLAVRSAMAPSQ